MWINQARSGFAADSICCIFGFLCTCCPFFPVRFDAVKGLHSPPVSLHFPFDSVLTRFIFSIYRLKELNLLVKNIPNLTLFARDAVPVHSTTRKRPVLNALILLQRPVDVCWLLFLFVMYLLSGDAKIVSFDYLTSSYFPYFPINYKY